MASDMIKCPHCECRVHLDEVEKEDGICPECGQLVMASSLACNFTEEADEYDDLNDGIDDDLNDDEVLDDEDEDNPDILDELNDSYEDEEEPEERSGRAAKGRGGRKKKSR